MSSMFFKKWVFSLAFVLAAVAGAEIKPESKLVGKELLKYCDGHKGRKPEIDYWTIKKIIKDKVYLDFGNSILFYGCAKYSESVYAFTPEGEMVPLKFMRIIKPEVHILKGEDSSDNKRCECINMIYGYCTNLLGREAHQRGYGKGTCRYEGEYTFDPKYKLKKETIAVHIPDISKAKFELLKDIKVYSDSPEGQEFMKKKFYGSQYGKDNGVYFTFSASKNCKDEKCSRFVTTIHDPKKVFHRGEITVSENDFEVRILGNSYLYDQTKILYNNKLMCTACIKDPECKTLDVEGKLIIDDREYFIIYAHTQHDKREHILFESRKDQFGKMINYSSDIFCSPSKWPEEKEK